MNNLTDTDDVPKLVREVLRDLGLRTDADLHGNEQQKSRQRFRDGMEYLCLFATREEYTRDELATYCGCCYQQIANLEIEGLRQMKSKLQIALTVEYFKNQRANDDLPEIDAMPEPREDFSKLLSSFSLS